MDWLLSGPASQSKSRLANCLDWDDVDFSGQTGTSAPAILNTGCHCWLVQQWHPVNEFFPFLIEIHLLGSELCSTEIEPL